MKKFVAYALFLVYAVALLKPVLPPLADWVEHTFFLHHHLATVHHHHGHGHVEKEMAKEVEDHPTEKAPALFAEPVSVHVVEQITTTTPPEAAMKGQTFGSFSTPLYSAPHATDAPPPWLVPAAV